MSMPNSICDDENHQHDMLIGFYKILNMLPPK